MDDIALLRRYAETGSEEAFTALVGLHLNLVYSAALRQVGGDAHRAEDITQIVFAEVARQAAALCRHPALAGWLYTSTHYTAAKIIRAERRRQIREQEAQIMNEALASPEPAVDWDRVRPVLDEAMHELSKGERDAVVLRFFNQQRMTAVGEKLGLTESAARKRLDRALENLRTLLSRRGITSTPAALAALLASQTVGAAPVGLVATVSSSALGAAATGGAGFLTLLQLMSTTKLAVGAVVIVLSFGLGSYFGAVDPGPASPAPTVTPSLAARVSPPNPPPSAPRALTVDFAPVPVVGPVSLEVARARDIVDLAQRGLLLGYRIGGETSAGPDARLGEVIGTFGEVLALSPTETDTMRQLAENARQAIIAKVAVGATASRLSDEEVLITLGNAGAASAIADDLDDSLRQLLGDDRYVGYDKLGVKEALANNFRNLGLNAATIKVTRTRNGERRDAAGAMVPDRQYLIGYEPVATLDPQSATRFRFGQTSTNVPARLLGPLGALLPADF